MTGGFPQRHDGGYMLRLPFARRAVCASCVLRSVFSHSWYLLSCFSSRLTFLSSCSLVNLFFSTIAMPSSRLFCWVAIVAHPKDERPTRARRPFGQSPFGLCLWELTVFLLAELLAAGHAVVDGLDYLRHGRYPPFINLPPFNTLSIRFYIGKPPVVLGWRNSAQRHVGGVGLTRP